VLTAHDDASRALRHLWGLNRYETRSIWSKKQVRAIHQRNKESEGKNHSRVDNVQLSKQPALVVD
jgi:hypothetical protein